MITKTKIEKKASRKTNKKLAECINKIKKTNLEIAKLLALPKRKKIELNLKEINEKTKDGDKVIIPGKILSQGELNKKIKIVAWKFSNKSLEKIQKSKSEAIEISEELKKNPKLESLKLLK